MTLTLNQTYTVYLMSDYHLVIILLRLPKKSNPYYLWEHTDGRTFENREIDVDIWIKRKQISILVK